MQVKSFLLTMGAGIAVGALGAMMLPKNSEVLARLCVNTAELNGFKVDQTNPYGAACAPSTETSASCVPAGTAQVSPGSSGPARSASIASSGS